MRASLAIKILVPVLLTISMGMLGASYLSHIKARSVVEHELGTRLQREVRITAQLMDRWLEDRLKDIATWSDLEICREALIETGYYGKSARRGASQFLAELEHGYPYYDFLFLADLQGNLVASSHSSMQEKYNIQTRDYFQKTMHGTDVISEVLTSMESGKQVITVSSAVADANGTIVGLLVGAVDLASFSKLFVSDFHLAERSWAFILNDQGGFIASSSPPQRFAPTDRKTYATAILAEHNDLFVYEAESLNMLTARQPLKANAWIFCVGQALDVTMAPLAAIGKFSLVIDLIMLLALFIFIGTLFKQLIINRLTIILGSIAKVQDGDLQVRIPHDGLGPDELTTVQDAFNRMTRQLAVTLDDLRSEITTRKSAERDLAEHKDSLEEIIRRRSAQLEREVYERKRVEERLHRAEKMEMIGTLAGGVAHDLNNILSGVVSYPDLLLHQLEPDNPMRKPLETIRASGEKASAIVQDLLTLARRGVTVKEVVDLNALVEQYLSSPELARLIAQADGISIRTELAANLLPVAGSPVHLAKTLMNLVVNGIESMESGGRLTIGTTNVYVDAPLEGHDTVAEGDYAVLTVADEGHGIAREDIEKIFEPFYTRKKMGRSGTGLGMAVVWGTVKDHHGYITCDSTLGQGTTFRLYFPTTDYKGLHEDDSQKLADISGSGQLILVVDDVQEQREIATAILRELGYRVEAAASGEEAVMMSGRQHYDLLVLDMILGEGMDGLDTYRQVLQKSPGQRAIITSGYSETERIVEALRLGAGRYVKKPYMLQKIGLAVKEELAKKPAA